MECLVKKEADMNIKDKKGVTFNRIVKLTRTPFLSQDKSGVCEIILVAYQSYCPSYPNIPWLGDGKVWCIPQCTSLLARQGVNISIKDNARVKVAIS